jgi:hypothetical protein
MRPRTKTWRPRLEALEDRCTPSTFAAFGLDAPEAGPFPSDRFTVPDPSQLTDRRINLPLPDAATRPSDYDDIRVLNTLDGFNLQPRLSVPFSGPIDVNTVNSQTVFLIKLNDPTAPQERGGRVVGINQVVWDVATNTLHVESDELLEQHTRYALIVTRGIRDADGQPVEPSAEFARFRHGLNFGQAHDPALKAYRKDLLDALGAARRAGVAGRDVVAASVFTTMSATALLEKMRDQVHAAAPAPADFLLGPGGTRTVFAIDQVSSIAFNRQLSVTGPPSSVPVSLSQVRAVPGAVGSVAFGKYASPDYQVHPGEYIPPVGTRTGTPAVQRMNDVYFNLFLPSGPEPEAGWPVVLIAHGGPQDKQGAPLAFVAEMAAHGIASILINGVGRGAGPLSTLTVTPTTGDPVTFSAGGRSIDQNGDGLIGVREGTAAAPPYGILGESDAYRQTAVDWMRLVRVIEAGMDVDGDGVRDLDPSRVTFAGLSWGAILGTILLAVEPGVRAGALMSPGAGGLVQYNRLSAGGPTPPPGRPTVGAILQARVPSLLNSPGLTSIGGVPVPGPHFDENLPLRNQPPVVNTVAGAMALQEFFEHAEWAGMSGDPVAYAPHLRKDPLPGVPAKSVVIVVSKGDETLPNPWTAAIVRAGDLADRTIVYRNDLAYAADNRVAKNPHLFPQQIESTVPLVRQLAFGVQEVIATFLGSGGSAVIDPEPSRFFEPLIDLSVLEDLNYIP